MRDQSIALVFTWLAMAHNPSTLDVKQKMWGVSPQEFAWFTDTADYCPHYGGTN